MDQAPEKNWTLRVLARVAGYSPFHLLRIFREVFRQTPHRYLVRRRLDKARRFLAETDLSVTEISLQVGFESLGSFSQTFRQVVGWAPSVYRARVRAQAANPLAFIPACHVGRYGLASPPQFSRSAPSLSRA